MAVDGELGDAGFAGDLVHAGAVETVFGEHALGGIEDRCALGEILRTAGAGGPGRRGGGTLAGGGGGRRVILYPLVRSLSIHRGRRCRRWGFPGAWRSPPTAARFGLTAGGRAQPAGQVGPQR